jgi:hypothetical protein
MQWLKARIVERTDAAIARQQQGKHVSVATNKYSNRGCNAFYMLYSEVTQ